MEISSIIDSRLDAIFDRVDALADENNFELIDEQLKILDVETESIGISVGYLTITFTMIDKLKERTGLKLRLETHMLKTLGVEKTRDMLAGL